MCAGIKTCFQNLLQNTFWHNLIYWEHHRYFSPLKKSTWVFSITHEQHPPLHFTIATVLFRANILLTMLYFYTNKVILALIGANSFPGLQKKEKYRNNLLALNSLFSHYSLVNKGRKKYFIYKKWKSLYIYNEFCRDRELMLGA